MAAADPTFPVLRSERLLMRAFGPADLEPFAALNADPRVMEHFPRPLERAESDALVESIARHFRRHGFGLWAIEVRAEPHLGELAGFVGLAVPNFEAPFTPCVEVGWRLSFRHWGRGYASEAASRALELAFDEIGLDEIVSFTVPANRRSRRVMERLGMKRRPEEDFDHPNLPAGHPLQRHVLYRLRREDRHERRSLSGDRS